MLVLEDEFVKAAQMSEQELKLEIAIMLYLLKKVSSRKAAKLAGITFLEMWSEFDKRNIDLITTDTYVDENGKLAL